MAVNITKIDDYISYDHLMTSPKEDEDFLGEGGFSNVYRCYHSSLGTVAVKVFKCLDNARLVTIKVKKMTQEIEILKKVRHDKVVNILGVAQIGTYIAAVLEYMPMGNLEWINECADTLPWSFRVRAMYETASGINFLHNLRENCRITHNDLKPSNILFTEDLHVKISDFGGASLSQFTGTSLQSKSTYNDNNESTQHTLSYSPPELLKNINLRRSCSMDVYSFGLVIFYIVYKKHPFFGNKPDVILFAITGGQKPEGDEPNLENNPEIDKNCFNKMKACLNKMIDTDPKNRPDIKKVMDFLFDLLLMYEQQVSKDIFNLKKELLENDFLQAASSEHDRINIKIKIIDLKNGEQKSNPSRKRESVNKQSVNKTKSQPVAPPQVSTCPKTSLPPIPASRNIGVLQRDDEETLEKEVGEMQLEEKDELADMIVDLHNPFLKVGDIVRVLSDSRESANAQAIHPIDALDEIKGKEGRITESKSDGKFNVQIADKSYTLPTNILQRIYNSRDLVVGDIVKVTLDIETLGYLQEGHGNLTSEMKRFRNEPGLIFRFLSNSSDVLVVYKDGSYFRYNPEALEKVDRKTKKDFTSTVCKSNVQLKVESLVYHDMDDETVKALQHNYGGWNPDMKFLQRKVGKLVYIDSRDRVYVAFSGKLCFVFNPVIFKVTNSIEAVGIQVETTERYARLASQQESRSLKPTGLNDFENGSFVKICLPLDIVISLQKESGGWCYQMLEVYGIKGKVLGKDTKGNIQILYDTGNRWTFHPAAVSRENAIVKDPYEPPFRIGDKVKIQLGEIGDIPENQLMYALRNLFDIEMSHDKIDILKQTGTVLGIDDDMDIIVEYGEGDNAKKYGIRNPSQLVKVS